MKNLLLLLAGLTLVWGTKDLATCRCGMFIQMDDDVHMVYHLDPINIETCEPYELCKIKCAEEFNTLTDGGNLNNELNSGYTVAQEICLTMMQHHGVHDVQNAVVYGYANMCNGPWMWDGVSSINKLCCDRGHNTPC
ncbi:uncharacterized protein [Panulirus ornatus]|uniref:uncharacterized protein n=1 Tax=Panulirus ornatus TaxID=150431 RepID=UPI003A841E67